MNTFRRVLLLTLFFGLQAQASDFVLHLISPRGERDARYEYEFELVQLVMKKTQQNFGAYEIEYAPPMNHRRMLLELKRRHYPNLLVSMAYKPHLESEFGLGYVPIPIFRGLLGLRTCFVSPAKRDTFASDFPNDRLVDFVHGQGVGWADAMILESNGLKVLESAGYTNLFRMVMENRFDLFCRGANEIKNEYQTWSPRGILYDKTKAFYYDNPCFFYFDKNNTELATRLRAGLKLAVEDGSFHTLWKQHNGESAEFVNSTARKVFVIDNPLTKTLETNYRQYFSDEILTITQRGRP